MGVDVDGITVAIVFLIGIACILIGKLHSDYKKRSQGKKGEKIVEKKLRFWLGRKNNYIFNDITLNTGSGHTTQIDHLVICSRGIFCIETKFLNGTIKGDKDDLNWTHVNRRGDKNTIYNPLKQNQKHLYHLSRLLRIPVENIHGYVVNVGTAKLKGDIAPFFSKSLIKQGTGFIFSMCWKQKGLYSQEQVEEWVGVLGRYTLERNRETERKHIKNVRKHSKSKWF